MKVIKLTLILLTSLFVFACAGQGNNSVESDQNPSNTKVAEPKAESTPADELARGRKIYESNCAACHREDGTGGKITIEGKTIKPDNLASAKIRNFDDATIYKYIYNGVEDEGMPAFKDKLSEADIREVVRFIRVEIQKNPTPDTSK